MEVEEGGEGVPQEGVDTGGEGPRDVGVAEPLAHDAPVPGFDEGVVVGATGARLGEGADAELVEQLDDAVVDVLRSVVGVQGLDGEGEGGDEGLEEGDEVGLGDVGDRPEVLELGHLIDHVDDIDPLVALPVAEVDGVDAQMAGAAVRRRLSALADAHRGGSCLVEGESAPPVGAGLSQVVDVAVGDRAEPTEAFVAVEFVHAPQDLLGGGAGELTAGLVDLGQERDVCRRVAAREGPCRGLVAVVPDVAGPAMLPDEAIDLCPGEARGLLEEAQNRPFVSPPEAWVEDPLHRHGDEGVGPVAVEVGDLGPIGALHERPHLVDGPNLVERKVHDHTPMIVAPRPSASPLGGKRPPLQPHLSLDKTSPLPPTSLPVTYARPWNERDWAA